MVRGWSVWVLMLALVMQGLPGGSLAAEMHGASTTVVINEVAWSGTTASSSDEWLELYNAARRRSIWPDGRCAMVGTSI
ncbi:MAG: hypothetical protein HZY76_10550 [Anaerolineae bacterium]|nr:MAG: hypothetical protein HZY76_10550 [Anaerolineae bacterium]